jgi:hypothetical protein
MTTPQKQRSRRALGIARGAKLAAFEAVEDAIGGKEAVAALVSRDDARGVASDLDDIGVGDGGSLAGPYRRSCLKMRTELAYRRINDRRRSPQRSNAAPCACARRRSLMFESFSCG